MTALQARPRLPPPRNPMGQTDRQEELLKMGDREYQMTPADRTRPVDEIVGLDAALSAWDPWLIRMYIETLSALSRRAIH